MIGGMVTWQDITERKEAAAALEQYAGRLAASNRELQQFASVASHDLQEPLRKIQAFSDLLMKSEAVRQLPAETRDVLRRMSEAAARMQRMIDDLLTFSRVSTQARPPERVDLKKVLGEVLWNLEARLNATQGKVEIEDLPPLYADPFQMRQLFQNLVSNALKYHRPDVPPVVRVWGKTFSQPGQSVTEWVKISVEDNGIGFDPQYTGRIFQPFERLHGRSEYDGTGMGLAICQKIVERHHGTITAQGRPGEGATFIVTLPARQPPN